MDYEIVDKIVLSIPKGTKDKAMKIQKNSEEEKQCIAFCGKDQRASTIFNTAVVLSVHSPPISIAGTIAVDSPLITSIKRKKGENVVISKIEIPANQ